MKQTRAQIVDELGALQAKLAEAAAAAKVKASLLQPDRVRAAELEAIVLGWHAQDAPEKEAVDEGKRYTVLTSKCEIRRAILPTYADLFGKLGKERFLLAVGFSGLTLTGLKAAATEEQFAEYVSEERTGPRTIDVVAKAAARKVA